jgi:hypothetical protein
MEFDEETKFISSKLDGKSYLHKNNLNFQKEIQENLIRRNRKDRFELYQMLNSNELERYFHLFESLGLCSIHLLEPLGSEGLSQIGVEAEDLDLLLDLIYNHQKQANLGHSIIKPLENSPNTSKSIFTSLELTSTRLPTVNKVNPFIPDEKLLIKQTLHNVSHQLIECFDSGAFEKFITLWRLLGGLLNNVQITNIINNNISNNERKVVAEVNYVTIEFLCMVYFAVNPIIMKRPSKDISSGFLRFNHYIQSLPDKTRSLLLAKDSFKTILTIANGKPGNPIFRVLLEPEWKNALRQNLLTFFENPNSDHIHIDINIPEEIQSSKETISFSPDLNILQPITIITDESSGKPIDKQLKSPYLKHRRRLKLPLFPIRSGEKNHVMQIDENKDLKTAEKSFSRPLDVQEIKGKDALQSLTSIPQEDDLSSLSEASDTPIIAAKTTNITATHSLENDKDRAAAKSIDEEIVCIASNSNNIDENNANDETDNKVNLEELIEGEICVLTENSNEKQEDVHSEVTSNAIKSTSPSTFTKGPHSPSLFKSIENRIEDRIVSAERNVISSDGSIDDKGHIFGVKGGSTNDHLEEISEEKRVRSTESPGFIIEGNLLLLFNNIADIDGQSSEKIENEISIDRDDSRTSKSINDDALNMTIRSNNDKEEYPGEVEAVENDLNSEYYSSSSSSGSSSKSSSGSSSSSSGSSSGSKSSKSKLFRRVRKSTTSTATYGPLPLNIVPFSDPSSKKVLV